MIIENSKLYELIKYRDNFYYRVTNSMNKVTVTWRVFVDINKFVNDKTAQILENKYQELCNTNKNIKE